MIIDCPGCHARYDVSGRPPGTRARCRCGTIFPIPQRSSTAAALSCPQCGASADPSRTSCEYCTTPLALSACPSCFVALFSGTRHCPHCGGRSDQPARPAESMENVRRCPRCPNSTTLVGALVGGVMLDRCEECDGIFLDNATLEKLIADRDRQAVLKDSLDGGGLSFPDTSMSGGPVKYLRCPDCAAHMARRNFGRVSKVIVDVCPTHGTWFDKDELRRIIEFVQTGGLDKARKFEIDQLQKEIDRKRETARTAVPVSGFNNATGATWGETALLELVVEGVSALIFWRR